ncbi:hypothetical protein CVIRNUC_000438 [Coccomyxa viridis]|uniref:GTPase Der n=1 Tax=Coccomyxa viridis TaxID=1274662 RepID=A0AAV1HUA7_9CHLO|nr:hypothetical protein CVIRNUC_000438 [Coccomyxa viridis]
MMKHICSRPASLLQQGPRAAAQRPAVSGGAQACLLCPLRQAAAQHQRRCIQVRSLAAEEASAVADEATSGSVSEQERAQYERWAAEVAAAEEFAQRAAADAEAEEEDEGPPLQVRGRAKLQQSRRQLARRGDAPPQAHIPFSALPKVAIVGRPNVGKSALFNRITGSSLAIVYDYPGVTRDRLYTRATWGDTDFVVVDTGGLMSKAAQLPDGQRAAAERAISAAGLPQAIERQAAAGVAEADALVLVMDGQQGLTGADEEVVSWLRKTHPKKPLLLAVNKCENPQKADLQIADFWQLGLEPIAVSAISGTGTGDLMEQLVGMLPPPKSAEEVDSSDKALAVAIIGRPNVGKSSILNSLVGEERSIVSAMSGTTRDAIDTELTLPDGQRFTLIDTAGIRKRTAVASSDDGAEPLSVNRALQAVRRSDVVALVLDASECADTDSERFVITQQDFRLAEVIADEGRACVIVINKWDTVPNKTSNTHVTFKDEVLAQLRGLSWATVLFTSASTGQRITKILEAATAAAEEHRRRISTATINMVVRDTVNWRQPPTLRGSNRKGRIYYATQAAVRPPTFVFFVNDPKLFTDEYRRYVETQLRSNVGFPGTPVRLYWRGKTMSLASSRDARQQPGKAA